MADLTKRTASCAPGEKQCIQAITGWVRNWEGSCVEDIQGSTIIGGGIVSRASLNPMLHPLLLCGGTLCIVLKGQCALWIIIWYNQQCVLNVFCNNVQYVIRNMIQGSNCYVQWVP